MNTTIDPQTAQTQKLMDVTVDVSKASLNWYAEPLDGAPVEGEFANINAAITSWLQERFTQARDHGYSGLRIVCEASGGYEKRLLQLARHAGCATALVSGEAVNKLRVVESNDLGKSDQKDPRTMMLLVKLRKLLSDRPLHGEWLLLRELGARYDRLERECTRVKSKRPTGCLGDV
jgi:transposase